MRETESKDGIFGCFFQHMSIRDEKGLGGRLANREVKSALRIYARGMEADLRMGFGNFFSGEVKFIWDLKGEMRCLWGGP